MAIDNRQAADAVDGQRQSAARRILLGLQADEPRVQALAWVSADGRVLTSVAPRLDPDRIGAMSASLLALSQAASREVELGGLRQVILNGEQRTMLFSAAGEDEVLLIAADNQVNLGRLLLHAQRVSGQLAALP
ncbi:roadblock/LC7 domain-containing protein [Stenotrophomonas mori]|uniref:Roadblock/LC7 domain-containing protein n=1 Tax=Stenotrophomonas mori TaxID=2871096 RepID=A0ABT0SI79_9GAMM|nr:roadblock/LC7 domain-containing protein [Stenotrophomonas mori]MCL7715014.1 roadblock/LC7 domain-containing protein [Stenotrophomonas mori]